MEVEVAAAAGGVLFFLPANYRKIRLQEDNPIGESQFPRADGVASGNDGGSPVLIWVMADLPEAPGIVKF